MTTTMLVRIKPYNPKRGQIARTVITHGTKFSVERGWYEVDADFAEVLRLEHHGGDPDAALIFDVCTKDEAIAMQKAEDRAAKEAASPERPIAPERVTRRERAPASVDPAAKSATPIVADGADDEDEGDEDDESTASEIGRLSDETPAKPAPKSRSRRS